MPTCMRGQSGFANKRIERAQKTAHCDALAPQERAFQILLMIFDDFMSDSDENHVTSLKRIRNYP